MENMERFEQMLQKCSYVELTPEEKLWVKNFVNSEAEYELLRQSNHQLNNYFADTRNLTPRPKVWSAIKNDITLIRKTSAINYWLTAPLPAYATLLLLIVTGAFSWYGGSKYSSLKPYAEYEIPRVDTVFIASKPDTVVHERIIYVKAKPLPVVIQVSSQQTKETTIVKGINMKEKENLEELLVSGSR